MPSRVVYFLAHHHAALLSVSNHAFGGYIMHYHSRPKNVVSFLYYNVFEYNTVKQKVCDYYINCIKVDVEISL